MLCCAVCALAGLHMSQSHDYSLVMPAYTSGQPSSVSDAVCVADMSSAVIGLSVTVALMIVISVIIAIIVLCHHQGTYGDSDHDPLYVIIHTHCHHQSSCHHSCITGFVKSCIIVSNRILTVLHDETLLRICCKGL